MAGRGAHLESSVSSSLASRVCKALIEINPGLATAGAGMAFGGMMRYLHRTLECISRNPHFMAQDTFYITTAISYPNGKPHIGHAYEMIATDAIARFQRCDGKDVFFLTGTDEHGIKMLQTARKEGLTPRALADRNAAEFKRMAAALDISNDDFIRTTEARHYRSSQAIWKAMAANGDIYKDSYAGWYSVRDEAYYGEEETELRDDGVRYGPQGTPVEWVEEESYFFRLSAYGDRLLKLYEEHPDFIAPPERRNEVVSFVKQGLKDLSVSRTTFDWGVPVPGDEKHVMYVWVDALTNYITGVGHPDPDAPLWRRWPADLHVIGKDIVRFHAIYWPAFLMSAGIALPKRVFGHGFVFNRGEKMSKSVGNVIDPFALAEHYGLDQLRYFLLRDIPFGQDGNYSHEGIVTRTNADLANGIGNLAQRSLSMIAKNCGGVVPQKGDLAAEDEAILATAAEALEAARKAMAGQAIHHALAAVIAVVAEADRYFAGQAPWGLKKTDPARMETVLWTTAEVVRRIALLIQPYVPGSAAKLLDLLAVPADRRLFAHVGDADALTPGTPLPAPSGVFPRYVEQEAAGG
jgi:methionyl-tRNA synthetase